MDARNRPRLPRAGNEPGAGSRIVHYVLPGGARLILEEVPYTRSVALGVWVKAGSRVEPEGQNGIAHLCEHMVFRGTARRSAQRLAEEMDDMGGEFNAVTGREFTTFFAHVLDQRFAQAMDLLGDMVLHAAMQGDELERERGVVLEEIKMYDDDAGAVAEEMAAGVFWDGHPLGRPVEGTSDSVRRLTLSDLREFYRRHYYPGNMVVAIAGNIEPLQAYRAAVRAFGDGPADGDTVVPAPVEVPVPTRDDGDGLQAPASLWESPAPRAAGRRQVTRVKSTEQLHMCVVADGLPVAHRDSYTWQVLTSVLGGGNSSRLFRRIRDELGLAYAVSTYPAALTDTGYTATYVGVEPDAAEAALEVIVEEMARLCREEPGEAELARAREQLKTGLVLSLESLSARMTMLGNALAGYGPLLPLDEALRRIDAVSARDVVRLARHLFRPEVVTMAAVGPNGDFPDVRAVAARFLKGCRGVSGQEEAS